MEPMKFIGLWKSRKTAELIKISKINEVDIFNLEYDKDFKNSEKVKICITKKTEHAYLTHSSKFISHDVFILSPDSFQIDDSIFDRQKTIR